MCWLNSQCGLSWFVLAYFGSIKIRRDVKYKTRHYNEQYVPVLFAPHVMLWSTSSVRKNGAPVLGSCKRWVNIRKRDRGDERHTTDSHHNARLQKGDYRERNIHACIHPQCPCHQASLEDSHQKRGNVGEGKIKGGRGATRVAWEHASAVLPTLLESVCSDHPLFQPSAPSSV